MSVPDADTFARVAFYALFASVGSLSPTGTLGYTIEVVVDCWERMPSGAVSAVMPVAKQV